MFSSLQIIWFPISAVFSLVLRLLWYRTPPKDDIEILERPSTLRSKSFDSIATTIKQDSSHVKVVEVAKDCSENAAKECGGGNG
ncbi:uncharacterized protein N7503_010146 [Penicillium pulvis]|uniref:uncharacterized protein n=1 Tax=Penicillium pulvis TaxID=1562058 RepID=UPI0025495002|nr:uncharacterized protein N7503_010146 [Penicillium pulvis]KAJ5784934.1 hypothetical protein N7503_010146 [Penicillium pulvis]